MYDMNISPDILYLLVAMFPPNSNTSTTPSYSSLAKANYLPHLLLLIFFIYSIDEHFVIQNGQLNAYLFKLLCSSIE